MASHCERSQSGVHWLALGDSCLQGARFGRPRLADPATARSSGRAREEPHARQAQGKKHLANFLGFKLLSQFACYVFFLSDVWKVFAIFACMCRLCYWCDAEYGSCAGVPTKLSICRKVNHMQVLPSCSAPSSCKPCTLF